MGSCGEGDGPSENESESPADQGFTSCLDFEDLPSGATFNVRDSFTTGVATLEIRPFTLEDGSTVANRQTYVDTRGDAGGSGQELAISKVNVAFDLDGSVDGLTMRIGEYGGNVNLEVNGAFENVGDFKDLDGSSMGGIGVSVASSPGIRLASISLSGRVDSVALGGQELWLDDVCAGAEPPADCLDLEDLTRGTAYLVDDHFTKVLLGLRSVRSQQPTAHQ